MFGEATVRFEASRTSPWQVFRARTTRSSDMIFAQIEHQLMLAYISGPIVAFQCPHGRRFDLPAFTEKSLHEQRNVSHSFPQWW